MKRRWLSPAAALAVIAVLTSMHPPTGPLDEHRTKQDHIARIRRQIAERRAKLVVIGNSMVGKGVKEKLLARLLAVPVYRLWRNSMRSAWWYLALKNVLAHVSPRPTVAAICFRNTVLTDPARAVHGKHKEGIAQLATAQEPLLHRLAYFNDLEHVELFLQKHWSLYQRRDRVKQETEQKVKKHVARRLFDDDLDEEDVDDAIERVLADENMDEKLITAQQAFWEERTDPRAYDFHRRVKKSLLPHIIDVAKRNGIKLVFVRYKTRRDAARDAGCVTELGPHPRPELLRRYIQDLRRYLEDHNVPLLDFTTTPQLKLHHFREHDHLTSDGSQMFTRLLAEALEPHLPD